MVISIGCSLKGTRVIDLLIFSWKFAWCDGILNYVGNISDCES